MLKKQAEVARDQGRSSADSTGAVHEHNVLLDGNQVMDQHGSLVE